MTADHPAGRRAAEAVAEPRGMPRQAGHARPDPARGVSPRHRADRTADPPGSPQARRTAPRAEAGLKLLREGLGLVHYRPRELSSRREACMRGRPWSVI